MLPTSQLDAIDILGANVDKLTRNQISPLTTDQLGSLSSDRMGALAGAQIQALGTKIGSLSDTQIRHGAVIQARFPTAAQI